MFAQIYCKYHHLVIYQLLDKIFQPFKKQKWCLNLGAANLGFFFKFFFKKNNPAAQAAGTDPSQSNSTNRQNSPLQSNCHNFWTTHAIFGSFMAKIIFMFSFSRFCYFFKISSPSSLSHTPSNHFSSRYERVHNMGARWDLETIPLQKNSCSTSPSL